VSEPEIKLILFFLFVLAGLAVSVNSEGVLPAFFMGLAAAGLFVKDKTLLHRIRTIAFTIFTPFYFIRAGLFISLDVIVASFGLVSVLLLLKIVFKTAGVWPVSRAFNLSVKISNFNALLFSTGITFGTIAAMYGFNNGIIDQNQYSILVTVVILSALIPTVIAQKFFQPSLSEMNSWNNK
ncbi:MAG: cation:proton antiporter, partial [Peptococcaceae bacterium]|nr:cation:proton antiporter [Peptococcaceae bacterium]